MLNLTNRPCLIGRINTRTEKHGEESVPAIDIPLDQIAISGAELDALLGAAAVECFFDTSKLPHEPLFPQLKPQALADKLEGADVTIRVGLERKEIVFTDVKLSSVCFEPVTGGLSLVSLKVQATPELTPQLLTLLAYMDHAAEIEIRVSAAAKAAKDQEQLPFEADAA